MIDRLPEPNGIPFDCEGQVVDPRVLDAQKPIHLINARFESTVDLAHRDFPHPLSFLGCTFEKEVRLVDARLRSLDVAGSTFKGPVYAESLEISANFRGREATFEDHFDLTDAEFGGSLLLTAATLTTFTGHRLELGGQLRMDKDWERPGPRFRAKGDIRMVGARIGAALRCDGGLFEDILDLESSQIGHGLLTRAGTGEHNRSVPFEIRGNLRVWAAHIGQGWECDGSLFHGDIDAENVKVGRSIVMRASIWEFNAGLRTVVKGGIRLYMAEIGGSLEFDGAEIHGAIDATRIKVADDVYLRRGFAVANQGLDLQLHSPIDLTYAEIGGGVDLRGAKVAAVTAPGAVIRGDLLLDETTVSQGPVSFSQGQIDGSLKADQATLSELSLKNARIADEFRYRAGPGTPEVDLRHATVGVLNLKPPSKEAAAKFRLLGLTYRDLADGSAAADEATLNFLRASDDGEFYPQPYRHLFKSLRSLGHARGAVRVILAMKDAEYRVFCESRHGARAWLEWPFRWLHKTLTGYGYLPGRALMIAAWIAGIAIAVYTWVWAGGVYEWMGYTGPALLSSEGMNQRVEFFAPMYALDLFIPVLDFGQASAYQPRVPFERGAFHQSLGWALIGFNWFLTVMGWVLSTLLLAAVGGVMRRIDSDE